MHLATHLLQIERGKGTRAALQRGAWGPAFTRWQRSVWVWTAVMVPRAMTMPQALMGWDVSWRALHLCVFKSKPNLNTRKTNPNRGLSPKGLSSFFKGVGWEAKTEKWAQGKEAETRRITVPCVLAGASGLVGGCVHACAWAGCALGCAHVSVWMSVCKSVMCLGGAVQGHWEISGHQHVWLPYFVR